MSAESERILALERRLATLVRNADQQLARERARCRDLEQSAAEIAARSEALAGELDAIRDERDQLARERSELTAERDELTREHARLVGVEEQLVPVCEALARQRVDLASELERLERSQREDRAFVIQQAQSIATSGTWRWGHRLASLKWRMTFRRHRNTDAVTRLLQRMTIPMLPAGAPASGTTEREDDPVSPPGGSNGSIQSGR